MPSPNESSKARTKRLEYQRAYYLANKDAIRTQRRVHADANPRKRQQRSRKPLTELQKAIAREKNRAYYAANCDRLKAKSAAWRQANADRCKAVGAAYRKKHGSRLMREMLANQVRSDRYYKRQWAWQKARMTQDPCLVVYKRVMAQMCRAMQKHMAGRRVTKQSKIVQLLGCEWLEFISYIESKFQAGMSWENHGRSGWHFDHIRPLSSFDLTDQKQLAEGCHFTNVQPLWAADNVRKGGKVA